MPAVRLMSMALVGASLCAGPASAQLVRPSLADSFRLGSGGGVLCQVQVKSRDRAVSGMFDRAWSIVCRDAARPVGTLRALRSDSATAEGRIAPMRDQEAECSGEAPVAVERLGPVPVKQCRLKAANVGYHVYTVKRGGVTWVAEGLAGYDSALELALRTGIADRIVDGKVTVATTSVTDPAAFARVQAGTLDPDIALAEGYRRNNSGDYAEAAEFFDTLQQRAATGGKLSERIGEYLVNRALQKSNLGDFAEADALFAEARRIPTADRVQTRLRRNFEALHLLNQQRYDEALARLDRPVAPVPRAVSLPGSAIEIGAQVAAEINNGIPAAQRLGASESTALTPDERAKIIDAQARQIRGTLLRLKGKPDDARRELEAAQAEAIAVRDGRVISITRLRAQILAERGLALEDSGDVKGGEAQMRAALALLETRYPLTASVNGARARLASYLARHGDGAGAMTEFRTVVRTAAETRSTVTGLGNLLSPYFGLLIEGMPANPALADNFFLATQTLVRPGVADTQAILARELSEGSGEGSRLFRQARTLDRDIERSRIELANLLASEGRSDGVQTAVAAINADLAAYAEQQSATQAQLAAFPQYRALSPNPLTLPELKTTLKSGEGYLKLIVAGRSVYAMFATHETAKAWRVPLSADQLDARVDAIRDTITKDEGGQLNTYPFDLAAARALTVALLGPAENDIRSLRHLVFEPDGAMLRLPANLLISDDASVAAYQAKSERPDSDQFDFAGVKWLGRETAVSTAVSARSFRDVRNTPASSAGRQYLGFGENAVATNALQRTSAMRQASSTSDCSWPLTEWSRPVSATELRQVQALVGAQTSAIVTGTAFTDLAVVGRNDLADYRILHFATHGLVTAPKPQCPAQPALLTSFGSGGSDGLLSFREIYDLKIDADLVILSACDTAGKATVAATRAAGVTTGGGNALDGLVRAFIGAGGRSVIASHWPAPDDFNATERLIAGLFKASPGTSVGESLRLAERALMDDPATSHPYYWSGFAVIGDGAQPLLAQR